MIPLNQQEASTIVMASVTIRRNGHSFPSHPTLPAGEKAAYVRPVLYENENSHHGAEGDVGAWRLEAEQQDWHEGRADEGAEGYIAPSDDYECEYGNVDERGNRVEGEKNTEGRGTALPALEPDIDWEKVP